MCDRLLGTEMVKIFVGEERKLFYLHQELICDRSEYFRAAFKGGFRESKDKTMNLEVCSSSRWLRGRFKKLLLTSYIRMMIQLRSVYLSIGCTATRLPIN